MEKGRVFALILVLALHMALLVGLVTLSGHRAARTPAGESIEMLFLRPDKRPARDSVSIAGNKLDLYVPRIIASDPLQQLELPASTPQASGIGHAIDWNAEARRAVDEAAKAATALVPEASPHPDWFPAPKYHKGDEVPGLNGETMVFINDHCYQVTSAAPHLPGTAGSTGMGNQTYCIGGARDPRGDLFKDLPAYKKLHPAGH